MNHACLMSIAGVMTSVPESFTQDLTSSPAKTVLKVALRELILFVYGS
jgi:hypothetical protein